MTERREDWPPERGGVSLAFAAGDSDLEDTPRNEFEGALGAAVAANVVSPSQAQWIQSLAERSDEPAARPDVSGDRRAELDRLLERLAHETVAAGRSPDASHAHVRFRDALETADALGLLDPDQRHHWNRVAYGDGYADEEESDDWDDEEEPLLGFKGVLPGAERGGKQLISVECYDGGLVVRCKASYELPEELRGAADQRGPRALREAKVELDDQAHLTDDAGTAYWSHGGGGGGMVEADSWVSTWDWTFSPGVPSGARRLTVHVGDESFELDVTGIAERPAV